MGKKKEFDVYEQKLATLKDKFYNMIECGANKDYAEIDAKELGEVVDMLKDTFEACYYMNAAKYYETVTDAMEDSDQEDKEMYMNKYLPETREWYTRPRRIMARQRDSRGRYMYMPMDDDYGWDPMREHDYEKGRMYFDWNEHGPKYYNGSGTSGSTGYYGSNMRDAREGRMGERRRMYMEAKEHGTKEERQHELETMLTALAEDMAELIAGMDSTEKSNVKNKMTQIASKIV